MKYSILSLFCLFFVSCGAPEPRKSEVTVEYFGKVESQSGGIYISEDDLQALIKKDGSHNVIFTRSHCPPCDKLMIHLKERGLMDKAVFLDGDREWVKHVAAMMGIRSTPIMVVVERGKEDHRYEGVAEIVMYLIRH